MCTSSLTSVLYVKLAIEFNISELYMLLQWTLPFIVLDQTKVSSEGLEGLISVDCEPIWELFILFLASSCVEELTLSTLSNFIELFHSLFWIKLKQCVEVKGLMVEKR